MTDEDRPSVYEALFDAGVQHFPSLQYPDGLLALSICQGKYLARLKLGLRNPTNGFIYSLETEDQAMCSNTTKRLASRIFALKPTVLQVETFDYPYDYWLALLPYTPHVRDLTIVGPTISHSLFHLLTGDAGDVPPGPNAHFVNAPVLPNLSTLVIRNLDDGYSSIDALLDFCVKPVGHVMLPQTR
ncbi:hypothetical protein PUNSTDRAFT_137012 [Punctularia strigosozonata HHB-11173 SS5]|uniref:uncharacterized protein n=1 Tax=Punctularia strigosozonata (strain HHB-11173) TaxID=741275 RepID=UPI0004418007|nr:uncharacterized protein PUNSTDRAFT_137012 [Punctularia strigosozonata HHB-11173 SS5]EIN06227.1 hypothetical protein PUNSTDRAFT_137012 [Punctularia strigosozonata HHB-11173 SS5]